MKRNILTISLLALMVTGLTAQNEIDVLRYSFIQTGGTTRSLSLGGATGAILGDFSSVSINPAGLAGFRKGTFSFSGEYNFYKAKANYLGSTAKDFGSQSAFSHLGVVVPIFIDKEGAGISGLTFGIGYNKLKDFGQNMIMEGVNHDNSLADEFVATANDPNTDSWDIYNDGLAWETFLLDSVGGRYTSPFEGSSYGQNQKRSVNSQGSLGEYDISLGANLSDKLMIGTTIGIQQVDYSETWTHSESDPRDLIDNFTHFSQKSTLSVKGKGVNIKVGVLAIPFEFLRLGASVQTGTRLKLNDDFGSEMTTLIGDGQGEHFSSADPGKSEYTITTPLRATGSVAIVFKELAVISVDYEYVDYSTGRLRTTDNSSEAFSYENQSVTDLYRPVSNIRVGGEIGILGNYVARAGYAFYGSPYVSGDPDAKNHLNIFSLGVGYRKANFYIDLGVARSSWNQHYFLYGSNAALVDNAKTCFSATMGFKFGDRGSDY